MLYKIHFFESVWNNWSISNKVLNSDLKSPLNLIESWQRLLTTTDLPDRVFSSGASIYFKTTVRRPMLQKCDFEKSLFDVFAWFNGNEECIEIQLDEKCLNRRVKFKVISLRHRIVCHVFLQSWCYSITYARKSKFVINHTIQQSKLYAMNSIVRSRPGPGFYVKIRSTKVSELKGYKIHRTPFLVFYHLDASILTCLSVWFEIEMYNRQAFKMR